MSTSQQRIALFLPGLYEGGAERVILNLAEGISARGYSVDLVLARAEGPYMEQIPDQVRLVDLKAPRVLASLPALTRYLRREHPVGMVSAMFANLVAIGARRLSGAHHRLVIMEQNTLSSLVDHKRDFRWQVYPMVARWLYPHADHIVAVSEYVADDLAPTIGIPRDRVEVIFNPAIAPDLQTKSEAALEHPWFREGEPPVILGIGRLTQQKAFDVLIRAFSLVRKNQSARLLILGEGEDRPMLQSLISELKLDQDVSLIGHSQNPYPYVRHASLFVLSSRWEGLPTVLIEALYLGIPIVATDCPGGSRRILQDGEYGRLVPVDEPLKLAEAMQEAMKCSHGLRPKSSWEAFHIDQVVERYLDLLVGP